MRLLHRLEPPDAVSLGRDGSGGTTAPGEASPLGGAILGVRACGEYPGTEQWSAGWADISLIRLLRTRTVVQ